MKGKRTRLHPAAQQAVAAGGGGLWAGSGHGLRAREKVEETRPGEQADSRTPGGQLSDGTLLLFATAKIVLGASRTPKRIVPVEQLTRAPWGLLFFSTQLMPYPWRVSFSQVLA